MNSIQLIQTVKALQLAKAAMVLLCFLVLLGNFGTSAFGQHRKALIVNGPDGMLEAIEAQNLIQLMQSSGYEVGYLAGRSATWEKVKSAAQGVHILIYSGHGSILGYDGTGGLCLHASNGDGIVSSQTLETSIQLAPNALVLFKSVCRGAGSSAGDNGDIGIREATTRVAAYARPFFTMGASAYYADNYSDGIEGFLELMLQGYTMNEAYKVQVEFWNEIVYEGKLSYAPQMNIGISKSSYSGDAIRTIESGGQTITERIEVEASYDVAFAGRSEYRLTSP